MKYVKWLLLDFQVDLKANESSTLYLEYGDDMKAVEPEQPVEVKRE